MCTLLQWILLSPLLFHYTLANDDGELCCRETNMPEVCVKLCKLETGPDTEENSNIRYDALDDNARCRKYIPTITKCVARGRNATECCYKESELKENQSCMGFCHGEARIMLDENYRNCLHTNMPTMYGCIETSRKIASSEPRNLKLTPIKRNEVRLTWDTPYENARSVHIYKVHVIETLKMTEVIHDTKQTSLTIDNIWEEGKYEFYVVAHAKNLYYKSQNSNKEQFSNMDAPIYSEDVIVPAEAKSAILACRLKLRDDNIDEVTWEKIDSPRTRLVRSADARFTVTSYKSDPNVGFVQLIVSSLAITKLENSDFGRYRCRIKGETNDFAEVTLIKRSFMHETVVNPPETPRECCSKSNVASECSSVCNGAIPRKADLKPGAFFPRFRCIPEFLNLLGCTAPKMIGCCIREAVPFMCLGLCDSKFDLTSQRYTCASSINKILQCHAESLQNLPSSMREVEVVHTGSGTRVSWKRSDNAVAYRLFYRGSTSESWKIKVTDQMAVELENRADEIVLMAINSFGYSSPVRSIFENGFWVGNYV